MSRCPDHRSLEFQIQWFRSRSLPPDVRQLFGILFFLETWGWNFPNKTLHETYKMEKAFQAIFTSQIKSLQTKGVWGISTCCFACQTKRSLKSSQHKKITQKFSCPKHMNLYLVMPQNLDSTRSRPIVNSTKKIWLILDVFTFGSTHP